MARPWRGMRPAAACGSPCSSRTTSRRRPAGPPASWPTAAYATWRTCTWAWSGRALRERETLLRNAPHLVRPLPFLLPLTRNSLHPAWKLRIGLWMYDTLARGRSLPRHRRLDAYSLHEREPSLAVAEPAGGFLYHDAQMNDARVTLENCLDARAHGAQVWNDMTVTRLHTEQERVCAVTVLDARTGHDVRVQCGLVVNASGPWVADIGSLQGLTHERQVRLSRGSHIVVPPLTKGHALVLRAAQDGRVFFVLPWKGNSLVGTTEVEHDGPPGDVHATEDEIRYLLTELAGYFGPQAPERRDVLACFAGVRVLPYRRGRSLGDTNRAAQVRMEAPGLLGIVGGKWTTHRSTAEEVVDRALDALEWEPRACDTAKSSLPGGDIPDMNDYFRIAEDVLVKKYDVDLRTLRYWVGTYGTRHVELLRLLDEDPSLGDPVEPGFPFTHAEVLHAVRHEWARNTRGSLVEAHLPRLRGGNRHRRNGTLGGGAGTRSILGLSRRPRSLSLDPIHGRVEVVGHVLQVVPGPELEADRGVTLGHLSQRALEAGDGAQDAVRHPEPQQVEQHRGDRSGHEHRDEALAHDLRHRLPRLQAGAALQVVQEPHLDGGGVDEDRDDLGHQQELRELLLLGVDHGLASRQELRRVSHGISRCSAR